MPTLYVTEPGARIEKEYGRILVTRDDAVRLAVPAAQVSEVVLMGGVGVTTPCLLALLDQGTGLSLIGNAGKLRGRLIAAEARNLPLRHKQYARSAEPKFALEIARSIVVGKLKNCRTLARRFERGRRATTARLAQSPRGDVDRLEAIGRMSASIAGAQTAQNLAELRGHEGLGSKAYFGILKQTLRAELTFEVRSRRPPKDPANALLSLAYTLLTDALFTACEVVGLDPYDGFFHADKYGRPALALDLVEEFRPIVADSVVLTAVNNRMIRVDDFVAGEQGGFYLSGPSLRRFVGLFGKRLNTPVFHPDAGRALSYQKVFEVQAWRLRRCIESGEPTYRAFGAK
jgi:CRISPR-associated protein Cas1